MWQRPITEDLIGLNVLRDPLKEHECNPEDVVEYITNTHSPTLLTDKFSIVAVHGMAAHPNDTWCAEVPMKSGLSGNDGAQGQKPKTNEYIDWLQDKNMLPKLVPTARILRFGYRSDPWGPNGVRTRGRDISQKLVFALQKEREVIYTLRTHQSVTFSY